MLLFAMFFSFGALVALAGGGQNTEQHLGGVGEGTVAQNQNQVNKN